MSDLNQSVLCGNLGVDPKLLKTTERGKFVRISLATNKPYTDSYGEVQKDTQWHTVYLNGSSAKFALEYARTGDKVYIVGELRHKKWIDKKTGEERYETAVYAKEFQLLTPKPKDEPVENPETAGSSTEAVQEHETVSALADEESYDHGTQDSIPE